MDSSIEKLFVWDRWLNAMTPEEIAGTLVLVGVATVGLLAVYVHKHSTKRQVGMKSMRTLERNLVEDAVVSVIEDLHHDGVLSSRRKWVWYKEFAKKMDLPGLLRAKPSKKIHQYRMDQKKEEIRGRLISIEELKAKGEKTVLPLPQGNSRNSNPKVMTLRGSRTTNRIRTSKGA